MINLYCGRSDIDRTKFMFEKISREQAETGKAAVVLVPDQFTLETEKRAFREMHTRGLMDVEIMSFSRMAARFIEGDPSGKKYIDDLGRSMLLRKVISQHREELRVFASAAGKNEFVQMMGDMIQEFKQFQVAPDRLLEIAEENRERYTQRMLMKKLADAAVIYGAYEAEIAERYFDTEDYLSRLCEEIRRSDRFDGADVWVAGFSFFTKRLLSVLREIACKTASLNLCMLYSPPGSRDYNLFAPLEATLGEIRALGAETGNPVFMTEIADGYRKKQRKELSHLEKNLYGFPVEEAEETPSCLRLWSCENKEVETETIAAEIRRLVTEEGCRFKDIVVAVNDLEERRGILQRVFSRQGIAFFDGGKIAAVSNKYMQFVLALCDADGRHFSKDGIMRLMGTGIPDLSQDEAERLENYILKYGIEGGQWRKEFYKLDSSGKTEGEALAELEEMNSARIRLTGMLDCLADHLKDCMTGREYSEGFFSFLRDEMELEKRIVQEADALKEAGMLEYAGVTVQLWNRMTSVFRQLSEILEDHPCSRSEFFEILKAGIEGLEISILPTTIDQVLVGDYRSVRVGQAKVLFAAGMNDGIVPSRGSGIGIFNDTEKDTLNDLAGEICISGKSKPKREKLELYQTLTMPSDRIYFSYAKGDEEGTELSPSQIIGRIGKMFPSLKEERKISEAMTRKGAQIYESRLQYLKEHPERWQELGFADAGRSFRNQPESISSENIAALYGDRLVMSPTSLELYSRCPFAHFLRYGLQADERKVFEIAAPEMGTVFHEVLMRFSRTMTEENLWREADPELCRRLVEQFAEEVAGTFRSGLMFEGPMGEYRLSRVKRICERTAYMAAQHVNRGGFHRFYFEIPFGENREMPPVTVETADGKTVFLEGRIDRVDLSEGEEGTLLKVIDYKSGSDKVVKKEVTSGFRLQLMLYLLAAEQGMKLRYPDVKPAGVFYFKIQEPAADGNQADPADREKFIDYVEKNFRKAFKMDGILVNEPAVIDALDEEFSGYSEIIRVRKLKNGSVKGTGDFAALSREEFCQLTERTAEIAKTLCEGFTKGSVEIRPVKVDEETKACTYCRYKSVCNFDPGLPGFRYCESSAPGMTGSSSRQRHKTE